MCTFNNAKSFSRNSIYAVHSSYYSYSSAFCIGTIIMIIWLVLHSHNVNSMLLYYRSYDILNVGIKYNNVIVYLILILLNITNYSIICFFAVLYILWLLIFYWLNDNWVESFIGLTRSEQYTLQLSIKLLLVSELMLFFACFWGLVNFRLISNAFSLFFSFPLLSCYSFSIPFSNLLILLCSSLPIQAAQIFIKIGFKYNTIEGLGQSITCAYIFIILQCKEWIYSYYSLTHSLIGSIFYFTTGLHGFHVLLGSFGFVVIMFYLLV
jgi:cytochrome c oxidase subunit 3